MPEDAGERKLLQFKLFCSFFCITDRSNRGACTPKNFPGPVGVGEWVGVIELAENKAN